MTKPLRLFPFLAASIALLVTVTIYQDNRPFPTEALSPAAYRPLLITSWTFLEGLIGYIPTSWLIWFISLSCLLFLIDRIGGKDGRTALITAVAIIPLLVWFQPNGALWNAIEAVFIAAALVAIVDGRKWALYPLVCVATLNRETAVFIPFMFWFVTGDWRHTAGLWLVWALTYGCIRLLVGPVPTQLTLGYIWEINTGIGFGRFLLGLPFVVWLFWYAWKGWRVAPAGLKRAAYVIPPYLFMVGIFGIWHEWRLVLTVWPLVVPLAGYGMV